MRRRILTLATVLWLLLCVAAAGAAGGLWVGSYRNPHSRMFGRHELLSVRGQIHYYWWHSGVYTGWPDTRWHHLGFGFFRGQVLWVRVPYWFLALLPAAVAGYLGMRLLRQRGLRAPGLCPACGYDLRATPHAGGALLERCPECGRESTVQSAA